MTSQAQKQITDLAAKIKESRPGEPAIKTALSTSDRVLRRVTDGIYREPWSALRELISNAYDADAAEVSIDMDAPRFSEIRIRDDGAGFTAEALASMIKSIGGSPKRTPTGAELGVTKLSDPDRSPQGRKLIGKLGIGLFAVSQLTHEFQIITKRADEPTRTVADVLLYQYAEGPTALSTLRFRVAWPDRYSEMAMSAGPHMLIPEYRSEHATRKSLCDKALRRKAQKRRRNSAQAQ